MPQGMTAPHNTQTTVQQQPPSQIPHTSVSQPPPVSVPSNYNYPPPQQQQFYPPPPQQPLL